MGWDGDDTSVSREGDYDVDDIECPVCGTGEVIHLGDNDFVCLGGSHRWNHDGKQRSVGEKERRE